MESLRQLQEHDQFEIHVCQSTKSGIPFMASIICTMCDKHVHISTGEKSDIMISNWTRHVKTCITKRKPTKQFSIASYFKGNKSILQESVGKGVQNVPPITAPTIETEGDDNCLKDQCTSESEQKQCNTKKVKVDWSYATRKQMEKLIPENL